MDIVDLKNRLKENPHEIVSILEHYEFGKINMLRNEIRCAFDEDTNGTSIRIKLNDELSATDFGRVINGDLFTILMKNRNLTFIEVLNEIKTILGISNIGFSRKQKPFGGLFSRLNYRKSNNVQEYETYDDEILKQYGNSWNTRFLDDYISPKIQLEFNIGYDMNTNRISVPWRTVNGELCGIMGRLNYDDENLPKWFPIIPFPKINTLYGYSNNYVHLLESDDIFIGESEKFVLQLASYGYRNSVSLGGSNLSQHQIRHILNVSPKNIYLCFDEGLQIDVIKQNAYKFKDYLKLKEFDIYVVLDKKEKYIKKGSKASPSDFGKEIFEKIIKECSIKINRRK